jgi:hypothetical protein
MESLHVYWSESKQKDLESQLVGFWAKNTWDRGECPLAQGINWNRKNGVVQGKKQIHFNCISKTINTEIKYVLWRRLDKKEWSPLTVWRFIHIHVSWIIKWLNSVAPNAISFMGKNLAQWELSFRSYLAEQGQLTIRPRTYLAEGEIRLTKKDDPKIFTLRVIYKTLQEVYDERPEYEKDIWDLRKLGASLVKSAKNYHLNFAPISQPWLLQATKAYIRYCLASQVGGTCQNKLKYICQFSDFLRQLPTEIQPKDINRPLIIEYLNYLASSEFSASYKQSSIGALKEFLELANREEWAKVTDRCLIYRSDYPKPGKPLPKYIPSFVIEQLNQYLDALPPHIMRMVLILQETGRRISEICCLPWDCLREDAQGDYFGSSGDIMLNY